MEIKTKLSPDAKLVPYEEAIAIPGFASALEAAKRQKQTEKFFSELGESGRKSAVVVEAGANANIEISMEGEPDGKFATIFYFGENSKATLFVKSNFAKSYSEARGVFLGKGAEAHCCFLQADSPGAEAKLNLLAKLGSGAHLKLLSSNLGAGEKRDDFVILQDERGSRCEHFEASLAKGKQKLRKDSDHLHLAPETYSRSVFKYATAGESHVDVEGKVTIEHSAPGSDTHLLAKSLLLSEQSISKVIPMLFVRNAEVAAGHGSAMTPLQEEELFYLRSRGIGENESRLLVLQGFLSDILSRSEMDAAAVSPLVQELDADALKIFPRD